MLTILDEYTRVVGCLKSNMVAARAPAGEILVLNFLAIL
jgi:hypothetical protein